VKSAAKRRLIAELESKVRVAEARALKAQIRTVLMQERVTQILADDAERQTLEAWQAAVAIAPGDVAGQFEVAEQLLRDPGLIVLAGTS
jgi:surface antigen